MPAYLASMSSTHHGSPTPLEAVLSRLQGSSGFPTLTSTISDINRVVASESYSTQQITQVILRDVSLTTKLPQVVNSATYSQFGGRIRTVSKAVLILGGELVRNVAMTLMMLGFSKGRPQEKSLQDDPIFLGFSVADVAEIASVDARWPRDWGGIPQFAFQFGRRRASP